ncbi:MAG: WD40 repeat domain-containing protein [Candidatus Poribacteria bacterium]|nr:WD40 repeat domain-containing protein [Candidatus Poribacteria bacterium]
MKRLLFITFLSIAAMLSTSFAQDNTKVGLPDGAIARLGKGGINLMRFSPDGTHLVVGTDVAVWVYDVPNGNETALFTGHGGQVNALAFSPDGKILASGGAANPIIQLWELETGSKLATFKLAERHDSATALAFSDDGTTLISLDKFGDIISWDVDTGRKLSDTKNVDTYEVAALSQHGGMVAIGDKNGTQIHLWNTATGRRRVTLNGHAGFFEADQDEREAEIRMLAFTQDGKTLVSGSEDETVLLWNTENGTKQATLSGHEEVVTTVAFSVDGKTVASGAANKLIKVWDVKTERELATLRGHKNTINALTFAPEGTSRYSGCLASGSADGTIRFWDPDNGQELAIFTAGHTEWVKAVAFTENGTTLTSAAFNGIVEVWNLRTAQELITFTEAESDLTETVAFSLDGTYFISRGRSGTIVFDPYGWGHRGGHFQQGFKVQLWKITSGEELLGSWQDGADPRDPFVFSSDNKVLATRGPQDIRGWNMSTGVEIFRFHTITPFPKKLRFSSNGTLLAVYGIHGTPQVWNVDARREFPTFTTERASSLAFSPDNAILALGHTDSITLWNVTKTGMQEHSVISDNHRGFSDILIFSPDGKTLLDSKWSESRIQLRDVDTGEDLGTLSGHTEPIETLVFSHDGKTLASGSEDGTVLLWDWNAIIDKAVRNIGGGAL